jgi:succinoglycan biosynthesis transport protein ExoP
MLGNSGKNMNRNFDALRLPGEGKDSYESLPSNRSSSNRLTRLSHDPMRRPRLLAAEGHEDESDLLTVVRVFRRRWRTAARFAALIMAVTVLVTLLATPLYAPDVRIEIGPPGSEAFSIIHDDLAASDNDYVETQVLNLLSESLAIGTIRELHLDQNPEFIATRHLPVLGWLKHRPRHETAIQNPDELQLTPQESRALEFFKRQLEVRRLGNSRIVGVSFASKDPHLAAQVTNTLALNFVTQYYRSRHDSIMQSYQWIEHQLDDIRQKMEESNRALVRFQRSSGITDIDEQQNTFTQRVAELNRQLTQAEMDRVQYQSFLSKASIGEEDSLPQVEDNQVILALKQKLAQAQADLSQGLAVYGPNHIKAKQLQSQVNDLSASLSAETQRVVGALKTNAIAAESRQLKVGQRLDAMRKDLNKLAESSVLKKEAATNSDVYNKLYTSVKEASIAAASKSSNIQIVSKARVLENPTSPNTLLNLAIGMFAAIFGGVVLAFVSEGLDRTIRTPEEVKRFTGQSPMSIVPLLHSIEPRRFGPLFPVKALSAQNRDMVFTLANPWSPQAEAVRSLKSSILMAKTKHSSLVILVVSSSAGEGKTMLSVNLASVLAEQAETCLLDADIRRPRAASTLGLLPEIGLKDVLEHSIPLEQALIRVPDVPGLSLLPPRAAGDKVVEIANSPEMKKTIVALRQKFRFVVVDCPPIISYPEGRVLSKLVDSVILVGRCGTTTGEALTRSVEILSDVQAPVLGVVLNGADLNAPEYSYYNYSS